MKIFDEDGMLTSLKVPLQCVERWDLENEDVFIAALKNTASMMPPKVYDMMNMMGKILMLLIISRFRMKWETA